jgi:Carboxypeptidase regulatory-like domain/TonB-dependent Receptor Plug Domain
MSSKPFLASAILLLLTGIFCRSALAGNDGDLTGRVLRTRDAQPMAQARVQIVETGAKTTTNASGVYAFEDLAPGIYTVSVSPTGGQMVQHRITVAAGKTTTDDFSIEGEVSALQQITVLAQRTPIAIARAAQLEAPNLVNITTYEEIRKIPDVSVAEAVRRIPGISLETDEGEGRYVNCRGLDADLNSTTFGGLRLPPTNNAAIHCGRGEGRHRWDQ